MQPLDTHGEGRAVIALDQHLALAHDRVEELRNLIALRQVGIEVVLAVEAREAVDLGFQAKSGLHRLLHAVLVEHGQHTGHGGVNEADLLIGTGAEADLGAGK